ncbi:MAG: AAA family ATPase, partial [Alphaproteobacteria bacterium]|nr:AAA family ATPase [Alphaproteobacteria bacterium]
RLPEIEIAVVDEATQALEPGIWVAVPWTRRLVLLGDPFQLGPVLTEPGNPLERSLLERLLEEGQLPMPALEVQHRMHRDIQALVAEIYGPRYRPHPAVAEHALCDLIEITDDPLPAGPVLWVDTAGAGFEEQVDPASRSLFNPGEARLVEIAVGRLLAAGLPPADIGVIAPYSAQVHRLREALPPGVEVNTINAFQGREAEAIVVSWVRSNPERQIGFVADGRRLTVALTRARRALVLVGDGGVTLSRNPRFARLLEQLWEQGAATTVWEAPWDAALQD